jgi:predicted dehydrogenase
LPGKHILDIVGTKGSIHWNYYKNQVDLCTFNEEGEVKTISYSAPDGFDRNDLFIEEMEHFIKVINGQEEPVCSLDDGIKALELSVQAKVKGAR